MLSPKEDSLDYGEMLNPPKGFKLDAAICTTYTLDLEALVGAYVALGLPVGCDSAVKENPTHLFAAMSSVKDRILVFCEKGKIRCSRRYRQLYSMVEDGVVQVDLEGTGDNYPSFHPKVWLLRFASENSSAVKYRLCVLTRNLTLDGSWDLAASFEGDFKGTGGNHAQGGWPLYHAVSELVEFAKKAKAPSAQRRLLDKVREEVGYVYFGRTGMAFDTEHPIFLVSPEQKNKKLPNSIRSYINRNIATSRRILVMSPFMPECLNPDNPIGQICARIEEGVLDPSDVTLVTRRDALVGWKKDMEQLSGVRLVTVRGELMEALPDGCDIGDASLTPRDIHAKIFAFECKKDDKVSTHLCIGSANATTRAMSVNHEFGFALHSDKPGAFDGLLTELSLDDESLDSGIFALLTDREIAALANQERETESGISRDFDHLLRKISAKMDILPADIPKEFDVEVMFSFGAEFEETFRNCQVSPLSINGDKPAERKMVFRNLDLLSLTEFVKISLCKDPKRSAPRLVKCNIGKGADVLSRRHSALFGKVAASSSEDLLDYLRFRLSDDSELLSTIAALRRRAGGGQAFLSVSLDGLYESLLRAFADKPGKAQEVVDECAQLIDGLEEHGNSTDDVRLLLEAFRKGCKDA